MKFRNVCVVSISIVGFSLPLFGQSASDCFLQDFEEKVLELPISETAVKPTATPTVTVSINMTDTLGKVSRYIYGNNANPYMSQMVDQPNLLNYITHLSPNIIRYPGGNLSSLYFWNASTGVPPGAPVSIIDGSSGKATTAGYWYGRPTNGWSMLLDNYYGMLDATGSTGIITVNYGFARYGTDADPVATAAHLAAEWVRYDDGRTKFWEIGNESYGTWQAGYQIDVAANKDGQPAIQTGTLYGQHFKVFADSMRKAAADVGSTIAIGAQLYEVPGGYTPTLSGWNSGVLGQIGDAADFYIVHSYLTPYNEKSTAATVLNGGTSVKSIMTFIKQVTAQYKAPMKPLALTEWNIFAVGLKQACSYINGMLATIVLGELAKNGFSMSSRWDLANGYDNGNDHGMFSQGDEPGVPKWNPRPAYFYMYFFQKCFGDHMVSSSVTGSPNILAYASRFGSGHAGIVVVNKGTSDQTVRLELAKYGFGDQYYVYSLVGGTDNGEFSQSVYVNDEGPTNANGGPIGTLYDIPARAYSTAGGIDITSPARSVQYILVEPGNNVAIKNPEAGRIAGRFNLDQNYPNPFNPSTMISFSLKEAGPNTLKIFDVMGREVATLIANQYLTADRHSIPFNASNIPSGVYYYRLTSGDHNETKKMIVLK